MRLSSFLNSSPSTKAISTFLVLVFSLCPGAQAADRTTEAGEAAISDPSAECAPYYYAPSGTHLSSFPPIWQPATILANDTVAQDKWTSISGSIPNTSPKGTITGDTSNFTYSTSDPDCWWTYHQCVTPKLAGLEPDISNVPEPKTLGYGFDDGPNCSHNAFYDYLTSQNQKATMFYIGSNVMDWPLEAQRAVTDGHEVCVHTWSHHYMTAFSSQDAFAELYYTRFGRQMQAIKLVTGVTPTCWRPPFGDVDDRIRAIAKALGLRTVIWKYDSNDWREGTANITAATVDSDYDALISIANSGGFDAAGAIMLTHELNNFTMSEAIKYYPKLKAAFDYLVPVGVALNVTQPYAETNYSLPTFEQYINGTTVMHSTASSNSSSSGSSSSTNPGTSSSNSPSPMPPQGKSSQSMNGAARPAASIGTASALAAVLGVFAVLLGPMAY